MTTSICRLSAAQMAQAIAAREVSAREVVDAHLARIEAVNPRLNAIVRVLAEPARSAADAADRALAAGQARGPLHGVPITVKENIDVAGLPTTWGCRPLAQAVVSLDAPVVERMRAAGAIVIGRTNLPDMGLRMHTASSLHGATINPWDPARTPGGSSGGDACAVAAGMAALALGNDLGGSLRNPAHACGVASIRPTAGRVPDAGLVPAPDRLLVRQLMMVQGPIARRVADLRLALRVLAGAHPRDPWSMDMPFEVPRPAGPLRIAVLEDPPGGTTQPAVRAAVRRAADALADAGCVVAAACPPRYAEAVELWASIVAADFAGVVPLLRPLMGAEAAACSDGFMAAVPAAGDAAAVSRLWTQRDGAAREWSVFMAEWPLLLSPTWSDLPPAPGFDTGGAAGARAATELVRAVTPANLLGLPSACVPAGLDPATGLPVGVLLTGARGADALCLDAAEVVERRWPVDTPIDPLR